MNMALVEVKDVTKQYYLGQTIVHALRGVDLNLERGEFAAIWGPSGSGKTSLLNLIGLLDAPSSGAVWLDGKNTTDMSDDDLAEMRNRFIGFVFQNFNLIPVLSALENVILPLQMQGESDRRSKVRALKLLEEVGLNRQCHARPDQMSGGQRQRVAIARALITNPAIVLADEPTANLDSETGQQIINLMWELNRSSHVTFVFATHDPRLLVNVGRHICLADGRLAEEKKTIRSGMVEYALS
jgi:putative ABC transport system ATP-binding protein